MYRDRGNGEYIYVASKKSQITQYSTLHLKKHVLAKLKSEKLIQLACK